MFIGIDPGSVSGALGAVDHDGNYLEAFDIEHRDKHILALVFKSRILSLVDPKEGAEICMEQVHSMPMPPIAVIKPSTSSPTKPSSIVSIVTN